MRMMVEEREVTVIPRGELGDDNLLVLYTTSVNSVLDLSWVVVRYEIGPDNPSVDNIIYIDTEIGVGDNGDANEIFGPADGVTICMDVRIPVNWSRSNG